MKLKIKNKNGVILKTKNTVVTEDIEVVPDESIINGSGSYEDGDELVYGGEKATQYGQVLVTDEKIDLMANEVLDMAGETQGQTLDELTTTLEGVNNEINTQGDLIAQLQAAVDSLPEAGGGSGENTESCEVTVKRNFSPMNTEYVLYYTTPSLEIATLTVPAGDSTATIYCAKNTIIALNTNPGLSDVEGSITPLLAVNFCVTGSGYIYLE